MKAYTHAFNLGLIRLLRGMLTVWEKWVQAAYLESLPDATPDDVLKALTPQKRLDDNHQ